MSDNKVDLGCIGQIMADSRLKELLCAIYVENSVYRILNVMPYARAIRTLTLTQLVLIKITFKNIDLCDEVKSTIKKIFENLEADHASREFLESHPTIGSI